MNAIPGTRCRICRCTAYLLDNLPPACVCGHGQHDHGSQPNLPPRHCENGELFMTTVREPTPRSTCAICREEYFVHLLPGDVALPTAQTPCHGSGFVPPGTASSPPSSEMIGGNRTTALQSYLHPPLSPLGMARTEVDSSMVLPSPALQMWSRPGPPPSGLVNDRRMQSAMAARGTSSSPCRSFPSRIAQIPTGPRTVSMGAPSVRNPWAKKQTSTNRGCTSRKYVIVIHPEPPYGQYGPTVSGDDFKILRGTTPNKATAFIEQMKNIKLAFDVECVAEDNAPAAPVIHQHLNQHLGQHGLEYTIRPSNAPSPSTIQRLPMDLFDDGKGPTSI
ncbi:hypothetical protein L210DRAFT_2053136 [Boletus edulis BED1]|uniref:Uncharacterized protein n=1 Tax=Boletus edulis BED1 TaxID=1328754 RepID=A0AAD4C931_BOLED|nr:hypothetical protein L210DRAFT_2053136 [Boletus edulis BED1]